MTTVAEREYVALLVEGRPQVIRGETDYERAMAQVTKLAFLGERRTAAQSEY